MSERLRRAIGWLRPELRMGLGPLLTTVVLCATIIIQGSRISSIEKRSNQQACLILKVAEALAVPNGQQVAMTDERATVIHSCAENGVYISAQSQTMKAFIK